MKSIEEEDLNKENNRSIKEADLAGSCSDEQMGSEISQQISIKFAFDTDFEKIVSMKKREVQPSKSPYIDKVQTEKWPKKVKKKKKRTCQTENKKDKMISPFSSIEKRRI